MADAAMLVTYGGRTFRICAEPRRDRFGDGWFFRIQERIGEDWRPVTLPPYWATTQLNAGSPRIALGDGAQCVAEIVNEAMGEDDRG